MSTAGVTGARALDIYHRARLSQYQRQYEHLQQISGSICLAARSDDVAALHIHMSSFRALYPRLLWETLDLYGELHEHCAPDDAQLAEANSLGRAVASTALELTRCLRMIVPAAQRVYQ